MTVNEAKLGKGVSAEVWLTSGTRDGWKRNLENIYNLLPFYPQ